MKNLTQLCNHTYDKPLVSYKDYDKQHKNIQAVLKEYDIASDGLDDIHCFQYEIIYQSLLVKRKFEDVFFDTYIKMHDFWYDLTYLERKKQMNLEILKLKQTLPSFKSDAYDIYMPCFDGKFNNLYTEEIVLLDLKQYHTFIRTCKQEVKPCLYGANAYKNGFSSCEVVVEDEEGFVLYHPLTKRLYHFVNDNFVCFLSLYPKLKEIDQEVLRHLALAMLKKNEDVMSDILVNSNFVQDKMKKKINKLKHKKMKKLKKTKKREE